MVSANIKVGFEAGGTIKLIKIRIERFQVDRPARFSQKEVKTKSKH